MTDVAKVVVKRRHVAITVKSFDAGDRHLLLDWFVMLLFTKI